MRYLFRFESEHLLGFYGFAIEKVYADYDRTPCGEKYPGEMIFVAIKKWNKDGVNFLNGFHRNNKSIAGDFLSMHTVRCTICLSQHPTLRNRVENQVQFYSHHPIAASDHQLMKK